MNNPGVFQCPPPCPPVVTVKLVFESAVQRMPKQLSEPEQIKQQIWGTAENEIANFVEVADLAVPQHIITPLVN